MSHLSFDNLSRAQIANPFITAHFIINNAVNVCGRWQIRQLTTRINEINFAHCCTFPTQSHGAPLSPSKIMRFCRTSLYSCCCFCCQVGYSFIHQHIYLCICCSFFVCKILLAVTGNGQMNYAVSHFPWKAALLLILSFFVVVFFFERYCFVCDFFCLLLLISHCRRILTNEFKPLLWFFFTSFIGFFSNSSLCWALPGCGNEKWNFSLCQKKEMFENLRKKGVACLLRFLILHCSGTGFDYGCCFLFFCFCPVISGRLLQFLF